MTQPSLRFPSCGSTISLNGKCGWEVTHYCYLCSCFLGLSLEALPNTAAGKAEKCRAMNIQRATANESGEVGPGIPGGSIFSGLESEIMSIPMLSIQLAEVARPSDCLSGLRGSWAFLDIEECLGQR